MLKTDAIRSEPRHVFGTFWVPGWRYDYGRCAKVQRNLMLLAMATFLCFGAALNLFLAGATGRLYEFWSGKRGSARLFATIGSPAIRLALSLLGFAFLLAARYFGHWELVKDGLW